MKIFHPCACSSATSFSQHNDAFTVIDLGKLLMMNDEWNSALPNVEIFFAVKTNNNPVILKVLAALGMGFDCSSLVNTKFQSTYMCDNTNLILQNEIESVLEMGVSPERIVYAQPCKVVSHLVAAAEHQVKMLTFDNESELHKVKKYFPSSRYS